MLCKFAEVLIAWDMLSAFSFWGTNIWNVKMREGPTQLRGTEREKVLESWHALAKVTKSDL